MDKDWEISKSGIDWIAPEKFEFVSARSHMVSHFRQRGVYFAECGAEIRNYVVRPSNMTCMKLCQRCRNEMKQRGYVFVNPKEPEGLKKSRERDAQTKSKR